MIKVPMKVVLEVVSYSITINVYLIINRTMLIAKNETGMIDKHRQYTVDEGE